MDPRDPGGLQGRWSLARLVANRTRHAEALVRHQNGPPLPAGEVAEHTLAVLALSEQLAEQARAPRWVHATDALAHGADPTRVATAMGLRDQRALHDGLRDWAHEQTHHGLISPARRDEILSLLVDTELPPGVTPAVVAEMRAWLCECTWADVDTTDIALMPDMQIVDAVDRHWDGGLRAFLREAVPDLAGEERS